MGTKTKLNAEVKRVEFVCDMMSYTVLRGRWCNITVLHQVRRKVINSKNSFYEKLEQLFYHLPKYHMKNLFGDFKVKLLNKQLGIQVYIRIVMIMVKYKTLTHQKIVVPAPH
jgi:hypothetical protein